MDPECREHFASMTPEILAAVEQLERVVSPGVFDQVVRLTTLVDDHASGRMQSLCDHDTAQTLAHFPGIAPAWWVVTAHLRGEFIPPCIPNRVWGGPCALPPLEEEAPQ